MRARAKSKAKIEQQIENLLVAQALVQDIPKKRFVRGLWAWAVVNENGRKRFTFVGEQELLDDDEQHCGSAACFGGWVAVCPYFKAQGVIRQANGQPYMFGRPRSSEVSQELFGDWDLFSAHKHGEPRNDKLAVQRRIERALENRLNELERE